jgi:hypothetical protein
MSLGSLEYVTLSGARDRASDARKLLAQGIDPSDRRHAEEAAQSAEPVRLTTFAEAAERFIAGSEPAWRTSKHGQQVRNTLATYAAPIIGSLPANDITTAHLIQILEPIWNVKPETATGVRGRIESVLNFARVQGCRIAPWPSCEPQRGRAIRTQRLHSVTAIWR